MAFEEIDCKKNSVGFQHFHLFPSLCRSHSDCIASKLTLATFNCHFRHWVSKRCQCKNGKERHWSCKSKVSNHCSSISSCKTNKPTTPTKLTRQSTWCWLWLGLCSVLVWLLCSQAGCIFCILSGFLFFNKLLHCILFFSRLWGGTSLSHGSSPWRRNLICWYGGAWKEMGEALPRS